MTKLRNIVITDNTTGDPAEVNADNQLTVEAEIVDANGANLELTAQDNVPVELLDSNGLNLDLTTESNVPVALKDANGLELVLEDDGSIPVTPVADFWLDIACNCVPGASSVFKFGRSSTVTTSESVIWDAGGNYTFITSAETIDIVSTDATDNAAGVGARSIVVFGLDANYDEIFEVVIPTGVAPVTTTALFLRVYRMIVITSGTNTPIGNANAGVITATGSTSTTLLAQMGMHNGQTLMTPYTVPAGKTFYLTGISASAGQGKSALLKAKIRNGPLSTNAFSVKYTLELYESSFTTNLQVPLQIPEKSDLCWTAETTVGSIDLSASYGGVLIDD